MTGWLRTAACGWKGTRNFPKKDGFKEISCVFVNVFKEVSYRCVLNFFQKGTPLFHGSGIFTSWFLLHFFGFWSSLNWVGFVNKPSPHTMRSSGRGCGALKFTSLAQKCWANFAVARHCDFLLFWWEEIWGIWWDVFFVFLNLRAFLLGWQFDGPTHILVVLELPEGAGFRFACPMISWNRWIKLRGYVDDKHTQKFLGDFDAAMLRNHLGNSWGPGEFLLTQKTIAKQLPKYQTPKV